MQSEHLEIYFPLRECSSRRGRSCRDLEIFENTKDGTANFMKAHLKCSIVGNGFYTQLLVGSLLVVAKEIWSSIFRRRETREMSVFHGRDLKRGAPMRARDSSGEVIFVDNRDAEKCSSL